MGRYGYAFDENEPAMQHDESDWVQGAADMFPDKFSDQETPETPETLRLEFQDPTLIGHIQTLAMSMTPDARRGVFNDVVSKSNPLTSSERSALQVVAMSGSTDTYSFGVVCRLGERVGLLVHIPGAVQRKTGVFYGGAWSWVNVALVFLVAIPAFLCVGGTVLGAIFSLIAESAEPLVIGTAPCRVAAGWLGFNIGTNNETTSAPTSSGGSKKSPRRPTSAATGYSKTARRVAVPGVGERVVWRRGGQDYVVVRGRHVALKRK